MVNNPTIYLSVFIIINTIALSIQLIVTTSLVTKAINLYRTIKPFRVAVQAITAGLLIFLFLYFAGDKMIGVLLFISPEYKHLTLVGILCFFVLLYIKKKGYYEQLEIFGTALLIVWLVVLMIVMLTHTIIHFHLFEKGKELFNYLTATIPGSFKVIPYFILASGIIIFILLISIAFINMYNMLFEYLERKTRVSFQEKIIRLVYDDAYENGWPSEEQTYLKKIKSLSFSRTIFNEELFRLHETIYGDLHERIHRIFDFISVSDQAYRYLHHPLWYYKIKGLRIYAQLEDRTEISYITKLSDSGNNFLRSEAQLALARLNDNDQPLDYLIDNKHTLTEWDQINLIHYFIIHQKPMGDISGLLASGNQDVALFGLHCIRIFKRFEYHDQVVELTKHADTKVRNTAFQVLSLFEEPEDALYFLNCYNKDLPLSTRITLIRAMGTMGDSAAIHFLTEQILQETDDEYCIELLRTLNSIDMNEARKVAGKGKKGLSELYDHVIDTTL